MGPDQAVAPGPTEAVVLRSPSAAGLDPDAFQTVAFRDNDGKQLVSCFAFVRVLAAHPVAHGRRAPREEWLIVEWPEASHQPTDYWLSNLPAATEPQRLARLATCPG